MKYIKKVAVTPVTPNTGDIIDSMNPGDDQTVNAPSIHAVKDYLNVNTLTLSMSGSNTLGNGSFYEQAGVVHINGNCAFGSSTSTSAWNDIGTIPSGYRPSSEQWFPVNCLAVSGSSISGIYPAVLRITTAGLITMLCKTAVASCQFNAEWKI